MAVADEPFPVQVLAAHQVLPHRRGGGDLCKIRIPVAPEAAPPGGVQFLHGTVVLFPQPAAELLLAVGTAALPAVLVGHVPQGQGRVILVPLRQQPVEGGGLLPIQRRGEAMLLPHPVVPPQPPLVRPQDLRVFHRHPGGRRGGGGGQGRPDPRRRQPVHGPVQPAEIVFPLPGLQIRPGEDPDGDDIEPRLLHQPDILLQHRRVLPPLLRIIVRPVPQPGMGEKLHSTTPFSLLLQGYHTGKRPVCQGVFSRRIGIAGSIINVGVAK